MLPNLCYLIYYFNKLYLNINCDMNYKYLSRLMPRLAYHQMKMLAFPRIAHSFSVAGHQTFGHFLTTADPVMTQLTIFNNYFAKK